MTVISAAVISSLVRLLAPVVGDLYKGAKGEVKSNLEKWSASSGVRKATKVLAKVESVKTIWSPDKELMLSEFYYPSKVLVPSLKAIHSIEDISSLPVGDVIVEGTVGQGKSIFMRHLASASIRNEEVTAIPMFIEFRNISVKRTLGQSIQKFLESIGVVYSEATFAYLASSGKIVLLLDGFDELSEDCVVETLQEIDYLQTRFPEMKFVISSRPKNEIQKVGGFTTVKLLPLRNTDYDPFLKKLNISLAKRVELIDAIAGSPSNISGIIQTPLMLTLVIMVYQSERVIPPTLSEFFESLFQVVFTKHDRLKAGFYRKHHSGLSERRLKRLFESFCFMVIQMGYGRTLKDEEFNLAFDYALDYADECECEADNFRKDIVKVACLMLEEGLDLTTFLHKSILDFHAAAFIKNSSADVAQLFYSSVSGDSYRRWRSVLSFLESIDAYRYSNDYILPGIVAPLKELDALLLSRNNEDLSEYLVSRHPECVVSYAKDFYPNGFGPMEPEKDIWDDTIDMAILSSITEFEDLEARAQVIKDTYGDYFGDGSVGTQQLLNINLAEYLKFYGSDSMWGYLSAASTELHTIFGSAKLAVAAQDKKKLIFSKKPKIDS